jgi:hypothetical protein
MSAFENSPQRAQRTQRREKGRKEEEKGVGNRE